MAPLFCLPCCRRSRRYRCRLVILALLIVIILIFCIIQSLINEGKCKDDEAVSVLTELCELYHDERVAGNLCPHLCDMHTLQYLKCLNYREGKQVFKLKWMDQELIFKAKNAHFEENDLLSISISFNDFTKMVAESMQFNMPFIKLGVNASTLLSRLWLDDVRKYVSRKVEEGQVVEYWHESSVNSLWSLIQQDEYRLSQYYRTFPYIPNIIGSCGHFYAMEYRPSGSSLSPGVLEFTGIHKLPWTSRAKIALKLLEAIHSMDADLDEPLHMCDMKGDNFGMSPNGDVQAIDVDMAVFESKLMSDLSYPSCDKHEDCDFFDCRGWCDVHTGTCTKLRLNNNLQALCEKIFWSQSSNAFNGLLHSPPATDISDVLDQCVAPPLPNHELPGCSGAGDTMNCPLLTNNGKPVKLRAVVYEKLKLLLEESLNV